MTVIEKVDLKKALKSFYNPSAKECVMVDVPAMNFLMIDGAGDPNTSPAFQAGVETLYAVSYTLKFMLKKQGAADYAVMPLEGLWWTPAMAEFTIADKSNWLWTIMIAQPPFITVEQVATAKAEAARKKDLPIVDQWRFEPYHEGLAAQILHLGPFAAEGPTIARLHAFIAEQGYVIDGKHHEIYLSDFRRTASEKLKTVIRQPLSRA